MKIYEGKPAVREADRRGLIEVRMLKSTEVRGVLRAKGEGLLMTPELAGLYVAEGVVELKGDK